MVFIPKPINREGILIFGDGDMALFGDIQTSTREGFSMLIFRPLDKMKWAKQIQDWEYDKYDRWIKRLYRSDLIIPLNNSPDFPTWLLLCDYRGNEDTAAIKVFGKNLEVIRDLKISNTTWKIKLNRVRNIETQAALHPEANEIKIIETAGRWAKALNQREVIVKDNTAQEPREQ